MVGRQTSAACSTCKTRKVKCGLEQPACRKCLDGGWPCPGYPARFILTFAESNKAVKSKRTTKQQRATAVPTFLIPHPLISESDTLRSAFLDGFESNTLSASLKMMPKGHILKFVPELIGRSDALDDAVRCVASLHRFGPPDRQSYVKALHSLRRVLQDPVAMHEPETLVAASLLQMYEVHTDLSGRKWIYHARGVAKLLQLDGRNDRVHGVQRAILGAEVSDIVMTALIADQYEFLTSHGWHSTAPRTFDQPKNAADKLMRIIVDGVYFDDSESIAAYFASACEFTRYSSSELVQRLVRGTTEDLIQLRRCLLQHRKRATTTTMELDPDTYTLKLAALAAIEFFLLVTNDCVLASQTHVKASSGTNMNLRPLPDNLTVQDLEEERPHLLESIRLRFNELALLDPELRLRSSTALRVILGSLQATVVPVSSDFEESEIALKILDFELEGFHQH